MCVCVCVCVGGGGGGSITNRKQFTQQTVKNINQCVHHILNEGVVYNQINIYNYCETLNPLSVVSTGD